MQKNSTSSHQDSVYTFKDICFTVPAKGADGKPTEKKILSNISATVKSGHVLAIMGPSGAGKTTTLNICAGKVQKTHGCLFVNGRIKNSIRGAAARVGFVPQDDVSARGSSARLPDSIL